MSSEAPINEATLSFTAEINEHVLRSFDNIIDVDLKHVEWVLDWETQLADELSDDSDEPITLISSIVNSAINYVGYVGIGTPPPKSYRILIDTGSANTWVGANPENVFVQTASSDKTGRNLVVYGTGSFSGAEWRDTVTLSPKLVINQQSIGVAQRASGLPPSDDGILGLGPVALTRRTVVGMPQATIPTVLDNLVSQGVISKDILGVYFIPASESNEGALTFGGYDKSVIVGSMDYVPRNQSKFWNIDLSLDYGDNVHLLDSASGIVDTGCMLVLIATRAFEKYKESTGGVLDTATGLLRITPEQYKNLQPLKFKIGKKTYELTPNAQIWPRKLNTKLPGGVDGAIYLTIAKLPLPNVSFILGYTFFERYYTVYDNADKRVGFAATKYTNSEQN